MHVSVERLRFGLLVGAVLLVGVIASFLGYAHLRAHRFLKDLPGRMGADLRQETNGFTYSQTSRGRTIFTIHAAKALQRKDGKVTLHDVGIVLYGRSAPDGSSTPGSGKGSAGQELADRIYGKEFEYDQTTGVVRATGDVHIDLQAPIPTSAKAKLDFAAGLEAGRPAGLAAVDDRVIHAKTSGLVFLQKLGAASTQQPIEFEYRGVKGQATGADYNSDTGVLVLQSDVRLEGLMGDRPAVLRATHAEMNRQKDQATMAGAVFVSGPGGHPGEQTARADEVTVTGIGGGAGGVPGRVEARGSVLLSDGGATIAGPMGEMLLNAQHQPVDAQLFGGVGFRDVDGSRTVQGTAGEGRGHFDGAGRLEHVRLIKDVTVHEVATSPVGMSSKRDLTAARLDLSMGTSPAGKQWVREAIAEGGAHLAMTLAMPPAMTLAMPPAMSHGEGARAGMGGSPGATPTEIRPGTDDLRGDRLRAEFALDGGLEQITRVQGTGHTTVHRTTPNGEDNSVGNTLEATFRRSPAGGPARVELATAVQTGDVALTHGDARAGGEPERGTSDRATYDAAEQRVVMDGHVRLTDAGRVLLADVVSVLQPTGDATATGSVRLSYAGTAEAGGRGAAEPVHVLADRAEVQRASGKATFFSGSSRPMARLWQGGSQVEAPVIELQQKDGMLRAHGGGQVGRNAVRTVLTSATQEAGAAAGRERGRKQEVLRVLSRDLLYSDAGRRAEFGGGVVLEDGQGTMRSQRAEVFLAPREDGVARVQNAGVPVASRATSQGSGISGVLGGGGSVERIVAEGGVDLEQPGRRGHGDQVVYTAVDGDFVMTGTAAAPPKIIDDLQGTVEGQMLRFHAGDNSVVVSGGTGSGAGQRVRTETRVRQSR